MTGENEEACPFCTSSIPTGAVVCRGCGANKGIRGEIIWPILFFGALWLFWGPGIGLVGVARLGKETEAIMACTLGLVVTVVGFFPMRWMCRKMVEPIWRRQVA